MTILNIMKLLGDIIQDYMLLTDKQVIIYTSDFVAPKDTSLYIVISYSGNSSNILALKSEFDDSTLKETMSAVSHERFTIDIVSKSWDSADRLYEILMALKCQNSVSLQEKNNISIWREGKTLDLSGIEGSGALHRYQIPVIISNIQNKTSAVDYFDKFTDPTVQTEE